VNLALSAEDLAKIALCAETARRFNVTPWVAMLSFSNLASTPHPLTEKVPRAVQLVQDADPALMIDGRDDGAYGSGGRDRGRDGSIFEAAGRSRRAGFPGPDVGKHVLQATVVDWRSGKDRADPDRECRTGACAATWVRSARDREHRGDRGGGCETEVARDAELKADKRQRMPGMRMRRVLRSTYRIEGVESAIGRGN
jgi:hypothetical protein